MCHKTKPNEQTKRINLLGLFKVKAIPLETIARWIRPESESECNSATGVRTRLLRCRSPAH